jgi:signal transduction histidine kinase
MSPERLPGDGEGRPAAQGSVGLRRRVYVLMAFGILVPVAIMATVGLKWLRALDERLVQEREAAAAAVADRLDAQVTEELEALQRLAAAVSHDFAGADREAVRPAMREAFQELHHRLAVYLVGADRRVLAEEPGAGAGSAAPRADSALLAEVLGTGVPRLSGLVEDPPRRVVQALVPVRWNGRVVGVVGGTFEPAHRSFARVLESLARGGTAVAELVDGAGVVLASTAPGRFAARDPCTAEVSTARQARPAATVRCAGAGAAREEVATVAPLAVAPWAVVVRQPVDKATPGGRIPWAVVILGLAMQVALAGIFAWGAARSVTRPVAVLTREAERIAGGSLEEPIPPLGGDEVGRLGGSLERMRGSLRQLIQNVEQGKAELEQRVNERTRALGEANARLREREEERRQLLGKVITAQEDERRRIARELHDETSQALAALAMGLEAAQDALRAGRAPRLEEVKNVAVRTLEDVHRLILDLRPSVLDDLGLFSAIRWYAEHQLESRGIAVRCEFGELDPRLPPELETALFRICQEAMSNIARHAQATAVLVQVGLEGDEIRVEIEDDGKGFDPAGAAPREGRRSWGLVGIRERSELCGGTAKIESSPGKGTHVVVCIPAPKPVGGSGVPT